MQWAVESLLRARFPDYPDYAARVPRHLPRLLAGRDRRQFLPLHYVLGTLVLGVVPVLNESELSWDF
jgi:hypothetical protein